MKFFFGDFIIKLYIYEKKIIIILKNYINFIFELNNINGVISIRLKKYHINLFLFFIILLYFFLI